MTGVGLAQQSNMRLCKKSVDGSPIAQPDNNLWGKVNHSDSELSSGSSVAFFASSFLFSSSFRSFCQLSNSAFSLKDILFKSPYFFQLSWNLENPLVTSLRLKSAINSGNSV
jgi:hypothetical protein